MSKKEAVINNIDQPLTKSSCILELNSRQFSQSQNLYQKRAQNADGKFHLRRYLSSNGLDKSTYENNFQPMANKTKEDSKNQLPNAGSSIYSGRVGSNLTLSYLETQKAFFDKIFYPVKERSNYGDSSSSHFSVEHVKENQDNVSTENIKRQIFSNSPVNKSANRPPPSPKNLQKHEFPSSSTTNKNLYLEVPNQIYSAGNSPSTSAAHSTLSSPNPYYHDSARTSVSPLSNLILEESFNRRKASYSPLHSFTKLNNIRKKSISEISLILEVIRNAATPINEDKKNENYYNSRNIRDVASVSPYPAKSCNLNALHKLSNEKINLKLNDCVSLSTGSLITAPKSTNRDVLQGLGKGQRRSSFLSVPVIPGSNTTPEKSSHSVSPPRTVSQISSFIWHKKNKAHKIRWERLSPHYIQKQMLLGKIFIIF